MVRQQIADIPHDFRYPFFLFHYAFRQFIGRKMRDVFPATRVLAIKLVNAGPPARRIPFGDHTMHAIRRKKTVLNALPQAVLVDRIAEIKIGIAIVVAQRRSGVAVMPS